MTVASGDHQTRTPTSGPWVSFAPARSPPQAYECRYDPAQAPLLTPTILGHRRL